MLCQLVDFGPVTTGSTKELPITAQNTRPSVVIVGGVGIDTRPGVFTFKDEKLGGIDPAKNCRFVRPPSVPAVRVSLARR